MPPKLAPRSPCVNAAKTQVAAMWKLCESSFRRHVTHTCLFLESREVVAAPRVLDHNLGGIKRALYGVTFTPAFNSPLRSRNGDVDPIARTGGRPSARPTSADRRHGVMKPAFRGLHPGLTLRPAVRRRRSRASSRVARAGTRVTSATTECGAVRTECASACTGCGPPRVE